MRKLLLLILCCAPLFAVQPRSAVIGMVQTDVQSESITAIALSAASEPYTEAWLEEYAVDKFSFGEAYSPFLSSSLPLDNPIASMERIIPSLSEVSVTALSSHSSSKMEELQLSVQTLDRLEACKECREMLCSSFDRFRRAHINTSFLQ